MICQYVPLYLDYPNNLFDFVLIPPDMSSDQYNIFGDKQVFQGSWSTLLAVENC